MSAWFLDIELSFMILVGMYVSFNNAMNILLKNSPILFHRSLIEILPEEFKDLSFYDTSVSFMELCSVTVHFSAQVSSRYRHCQIYIHIRNSGLSRRRWSPATSGPPDHLWQFFAVDGPPGPSVAAIDSPPLPQVVPSIFWLVLDFSNQMHGYKRGVRPRGRSPT